MIILGVRGYSKADLADTFQQIMICILGGFNTGAPIMTICYFPSSVENNIMMDMVINIS